jgi:DUF4097 and DUF4098 domain-containing protein YvlB
MKTLMLAVSALLGTAAAAAAQETIDESFRSAATGSVSISNVAGSVTVTAWDQAEIRVTGTLGRGTERLELDRDPQEAVIRVILPRGARNVGGTELQVRVPAGKHVTVSGVSADVTITGVTGAVTARSTSGDVQVTGRPASVQGVSTSGKVMVEANTPGRVTVSSTSGDVRVSGAAGGLSAETVSGEVLVDASTPDLRARSVSGDMRLEGVSGRLSASSVSGDARVLRGRAQFASMESVSGDVLYEGEIASGAAIDLKSHSGDVELVLRGDGAAAFDVESFSGGISTDFEGEVRRTSRHGPGRELRHSTGNDGGLVKIRTFSGDVKLRRR